MDIKTLKYFLAIAEEKNMTAAAQTLYVSQSALSRQIKSLEDELGQKLFVRAGHTMFLTDAGIHLRNRAGQIIELTERTETELQHFSSETIQGDIYIGCGETKCMKYIVRAIKKVQQSYPHIYFHIQNGNADEVIKGLKEANYDFGLIFEPFPKEQF